MIIIGRLKLEHLSSPTTWVGNLLPKDLAQLENLSLAVMSESSTPKLVLSVNLAKSVLSTSNIPYPHLSC